MEKISNNLRKMEQALENVWTLYVTKVRTTVAHEKNQKEWEDRLEHIHTFHTAESFWNLQNSLRLPSDMNNDTGDFYLFKYGIKPEWEDIKNANGGRWIIITDSSNIDACWLKALMCLIGHALEDLMEYICGAELAIRRKGRYKIAIWIAFTTQENIMKIGRELKHITQCEYLEFQQHKSDKAKYSIN